jgi:1,2-diacylglycerol 3-alpha-glucosyltransferase
MKILHCCLAAFYIDNYGYQENILPKMHKLQGHNVEILASTETYLNGIHLSYVDSGTYKNENGITVTRLPYSRFMPHRVATKLRLYKGVIDKLLEFEPDIIWLHDIQFLSIQQIIVFLKANPSVIVYADGHADFTNSATNWISKNILHRIIYKYCAQKIDPYVKKFYGTLPCRVDFFKDFYKVSNNKVELLVMGVDDTIISRYDRSALRKSIRKQHNILDSDFLIISGGKLNIKKNIHNLVKAVVSINMDNVKLLLFGKPDEQVENIIEEYLSHESIIYIGWVNHIQIHENLLAADLAVFPGKHSVIWEQAVGCGLPAIFKRIDGHNHVDLNGNCLFIDDGSEVSIKEALIRVLNDKDLFHTMKEVSRTEGMNHFSYFKIAERSIES